MKKGKMEGIQEGIEKGKTEERLQIAQNMLNQGLSIQNISSATGLSAKEVKKIQEETKKSRL
jgi:predicted transposase/invertase (TIGR01784 family)